MALEYTYKVNAVRVKSVDGLDDVVKEVDLTVTGTDGEAVFELPLSAKLGDPDPDNFTAFDSLTEAQIVSWVEGEATPEGVPSQLDGCKAHIAYVVAKELEKLASVSKPLPWAPPPAPAPEPPAA